MKRILALILCFVMVFSLVAVAEDATTTTTVTTTEFSDVPATSPYKEAISTLTGLGIILGDAGANTFRPEAGITRAEFCVIVARLKNMGALNVIAETPFTDVTTALCDEWKVKAVRIASDLGIVAGMGDGTFAPDSPVTYEQAVKMLVCLLKYEPLAKQSGGWPAGYIAAGAQIGLTAKAYSAQSEPAPRQIIAQLVYNALDIPEMGNTTGGVAGGGSTIMDSSLKYTEKTGIVTATDEVALTEDAYIREGRIQIDYDKIYKVGSSGADKYFGKEITFYYSEDNGEYTIQSCKPTNSNKESVFSPEQIKHLSESEIEVYTDENQDAYDSYTVASDVKLIYNNYPASYKETSAGYLDATYKPYSGSMKLIDNDGNNAIDVIIITDAKPFVVSAIDTNKKLLYNIYDSSDVLDLSEGSSRKITIKKGSSSLTFSSIAKDNVLLVSKSLNTTGTKHITIEIVSNTKSGVIKAINKEDQAITVGSETYEVADICWNKYESKFNMDSSVTIYLDNMNKVVYVVENTAGASSYTYGYLISAGEEGRGGVSSEQIVATIFTQAGIKNTYPFAEKVKYYGYNPENPDVAYTGDQLSPEEVLACLESKAREDINQDKHKIKNDKGEEEEKAAVTTDYSQLVKYLLNSKSQISAIFTSVPKKDGLEIKNNLILGTGTKYEVYKKSTSSTQMFGTNAVNSSTKFFYVPADRANTDDYAVSSSNLVSSRSYYYETYDVENGYAKVAIVFGDTTPPVYDVSSPIVVVSKIQDVNTEDGPAHKFYINGSTTESSSYKTENESVLSGVKVGDVIKIKRKTDGTVTGVMKLFSPADNFLYTYADGSQRLASTDNIDIREAIKDGPSTGDFCIVYGTAHQRYPDNMFVALADVVVEKDDEGKIINATLDTTDLYPVAFGSSTKFYTYSKSKNTVEVVADSINSSAIMSFKDAKAGASQVYVSLVDGVPPFVHNLID